MARWQRTLLAGVGVALLAQVLVPMSTNADGPYPWPLPAQFPIVDLPVSFPQTMPMPSTAGDPTQPLWPVTDDLTQLVDPLITQDGLPNGACGGCAGSTTAPTVTVALLGTRTTYSRGEAVGFSVTVTNTAHQKATINSVSNPVPPGFAAMPATAIAMDGAPCTATTSPACTVSGGSLAVSSFTLGGGAQHVFTFAMVASGGDRGCYQSEDLAHITTSAGTTTGTSSVVALCDGGLGHEPWWSYTAVATAPEGAAVMNAGDANLVLTQDDTTAVPGHARVSLQVHRVYNSQDTGNAPAPNAFGVNWGIDFESWSGTPAGTTNVAALYVPPAESYTALHPVTVIDDGGSRQVVTLATLPTAVNVAGLSASSAEGTLVPRVLSLDSTKYTTLCVDAASTGNAPGVHLGMWRYMEVSQASSSTPCTPASGTQPAVVGFATERPDRVRDEFAWDGHKLDAVDGNGNEVRYAYAAAPAAGVAVGALQSVSEVASGRAFRLTHPSSTETDITDPAQRVTKYTFDPSNRLTGVSNPDGSTLAYAYGTCVGATAAQLCSATDPRGHSTTFTYTTTWSDGSSVVGPPKLARISDRWGATSLISSTLTSSTDTITVDLGIERTFYTGFDATGSAGEIDGIDMTTPSSPTTLHTTLLSWDTAKNASTCRQPDAAVDHNLCRSFRKTFNGASTADDTSYIYSPVGEVAIERQCLGSADAASTAPCPTSTPSAIASRDTTTAYQSQYVEESGTVATYSDTLPGGGAVTTPGPSSGTRWDAQTLYALYDQSTMLGGRGNAPGMTSSQVAPFLTTLNVDNASTANPNTGVSGGDCTGNTGNTGNLCLEQMPNTGTSISPTYRYTYFVHGDKASMQTPVNYATGHPATQYTYYADTDKDLSGTTSAGGWVKTVSDPTGDTTVTAYDAAGNVTRAWLPNIVAGVGVASLPGTISAPGSPYYKEVLHGTGTTAYAQPWRYVLSERDPLGDTTTYLVDANGNQTLIRSPRGTAAGTTAYDITQTFDNRDMLLSKQTPVEAANGSSASQYGYDMYGNRISEKDPRGVVTEFVFDAVNRQVKTLFTRGPWSTDSNNPSPAGCTQSASNDPIGGNRAVCTRTVAYDGIDNPTALGDAGGQVTTVSYDGLHRETSRLVPRNDGTFTTLRTDRVYDLDGNVISLCSPRAFTEGKAANCTSAAAQPYRRDRTYDTRNHQLTESTMHAASGSVNTTTFGYDADGNQISVTDANGHVHNFVYDADERKTQENWLRAASGPTITKAWTYDRDGNVVSEADGNSVIGYAYDNADRRTDIVAGWDSSTAVTGAVASADGGSNSHTRQSYDADGDLVAQYDARAFTSNGINQAYVTTKTYDADDRLSSVLAPRYDTASASDLSLSPSQQASDCPGAAGYPTGVGVCVTQYQYDAVGNKLRETLPTATTNSNRYLAYTYSDDDLVLTESVPSPVTAGNHVNDLTYLYDANGKPVKVTDALGRPTVTTYTSDELVASVNDEPNGPTQHVIKYAYDGNHNRTTVTDANGKSTTSTFTTDDLLASTTDADGNKTSYTFDPADNPTQVFSPNANARNTNNVAGTPTTNVYTFDNLLLSTTQPVSNDGTSQLRRTSYTYNDFSAKATQGTQLVNGSGSVLSDAGTMTFTYYPDERQKTEYGRNNDLAITRSFDAAGNPVSIAQGPGATPGQPLPPPTTTVSATYYLDGLVRSVGDQVSAVAAGASNATTSYAYDGAGDLTSRNEVLSNGHTYTSTYAYNDDDKVSSMTASPPAGVWSYTYDAAGEVTAQSIPNGLQAAYTYNADGTILTRTVGQPGSSNPDAQWVYTYDAAQRKTQVTLHGYDASKNAMNITLSYAYSAGGRLTDFMSTNPNGTSRPDQPITWDADGNRLTFGGTTFTYNADDSLASRSAGGTTHNYTYNAAGNMTTDGCIPFTYDGFDRLTIAGGTRGTGCPNADGANNSYDGLNRKIAHLDSPFGEVNGEHYDGMSSNLLVDQHEWGNNPDVVYALDPSGRAAADVFWPQAFDKTEYLSDDGYDSSGTAIAPDGSVACDAVTDPFGSPLYSPYGSNACHTGGTQSATTYNANLRDDGSRTISIGDRNYRRDDGVFLQRDHYLNDPDPGVAKLEASQEWLRNKYAYTRGDPVNQRDDSGHFPCSDEEADGGCGKQLRIDQAATQRGGIAPTIKRWIAAARAVARAQRKSRYHLYEMNDVQRTEMKFAGTDFAVSIDLYSGLCYTCTGIREHDGQKFGFNQKLGTWDCSPATNGTHCNESHTYLWDGHKVTEYDDGKRTIGGYFADAGHLIWDHKLDLGLFALNAVPGVGEVADAVEMARLAEVGEEAANTIHTAVEAASAANGAEEAGSVAEGVSQAADEASQAAEGGEGSAMQCTLQGGESFSADTRVVLANGSTVAIGAMRAGTKVLATNTAAGTAEPQTVDAVWVNHDVDLMDVVVATGAGSSTVHATARHLFWDLTAKRWTEARRLKTGDLLRTPEGQVATVARVIPVAGAGDMWDLTVEKDHDFYVTVVGAAVLVHNCDAVTRLYEANAKHRAQSYTDAMGRTVSRAPRGDGQAILDASSPVDDNEALRMGTEPETGLNVVLRRHLVQDIADDRIVEYWHGYVPE